MTGKFKYLLTFWIWSIIPFPADGQETKNRSASSFSWIAGSKLHTGFLMNHHENLKKLNEKIPYLYEIFMATTTDGDKPWHSFYRYPQYGISYFLFDLGSSKYLGKAHGVYPFLHFFLTDADRLLCLNMRIGAGIAYMENIFDRVDNYKNIAISSHVNAVLAFRMEGNLRITAPLSLSGGWAFTHLSNGTFKKPNSGLNYLTVYAGANYAFGKEKMLQVADNSFDTDRKWNYTVYFSGGIKTYTIFDDTKYLAWGLSLEGSRPHLAFTRYMGVLDVFYDSSDYAYLVDKEEEVRKIQTIKPALAAGYAFLFGKLTANVQTGMYLYARNKPYGLFYQRLALSYAMTSRLNVRFGLKTHWGQADYLEFSTGYKIQ